MQFGFPFIDILVIPTDATTTERRIVIDGTNGEISWYDSTGALRGTIGGTTEPASISFFPDDPDNALEGQIIADIEGAGVTRRAALYMFGPTLTGSVGPQPAIVIESDSRDGTITDFIMFQTTKVAFFGAESAATGPVGTVVGKVAVCNDNGTLIGYMPVYDTIT